MNNKFKQLPTDLQSQKIYQFSSDSFFHYLLHHSEKVRLFLCRYISDDDIHSTEIINNEIYGKNVNSKNLILDVVMKDNLGQYYNFEMQNYDFNRREEIRMMQYIEGLIQIQLKKSVDYDCIKQVFQMIIYNGKPVGEFQDYVHEIQKGDIERQLYYPGDVGKTTVFQLSKLKEKSNMELQQTTMNRLMQLFLNNDIEESDEPDDIIDTVIELHNEYIESEEELLAALRLERDRLTYNSRLNYAEEVGLKKGIEKGIEQGIEKGIKEGIKKGRKENLLENLKIALYSIYKENDFNWLDNYSYEQLQNAYQLVFQGLDYDEYINRMKMK